MRSLRAKNRTSTVRHARDRRPVYAQRCQSAVAQDLKKSQTSTHRFMVGGTVEPVAEAFLPTESGNFRIIGHRSLTSSEEFVALVQGDLRVDLPTLVRIHSQCMTGDVWDNVVCCICPSPSINY